MSFKTKIFISMLIARMILSNNWISWFISALKLSKNDLLYDVVLAVTRTSKLTRCSMGMSIKFSSLFEQLFVLYYVCSERPTVINRVKYFFVLWKFFNLYFNMYKII